ncbi:MAG TPA: DNA translocase FtsK [Terriglobales bacterium]|jgi:S-DNA-T family DNA segregation ATPase FtsK/SpoIIIE|nr:DNA translocase FtsK [Terriglobales bacterium]
MKIIVRAFVPTKNRRLNELVGLLLFAAAVLLFLALASYSPADPSLNTAASTLTARPARNLIGMAGALTSDLFLQAEGITVFLLPLMLGFLGMRWFKSREVTSPIAKLVGCSTLMVFVPALLGLLPWHLRWLQAVPVEGLAGRIVADIFIRYFNIAGAYILCASVISVALYLTTAFSLSGARVWMQTRFAFVIAAWNRFVDWRAGRAKAREQRELEKRRTSKPAVTTQVVSARRAPFVAAPAPVEFPKTGVERVAEETASRMSSTTGIAAFKSVAAPAIPSKPAPAHEWAMDSLEVGKRADSDNKPKTTMPKIAGGFKLPASSLLHRPDEQHAIDENELKGLAQDLLDKFGEFDITGQITHINPGPVVTTYEFKPEAGIKYNRITGMAEDLCLGLRAESILIERMPGKATVGIQVPNRERETIWLREVIESPEFIGLKSKLTLAMGKDINGRIVTADLASMPHLLIAGSTGTGKSVAINAMIMSILYKSTPEQVRLILVDPKRLELGNYEGVPHLYTPIITEPKLASNALRNAVREMERRLKLLAEKGVRNIEQYNKLFDSGGSLSLFEEGETEHKPIPYIVIIIDELADLMMLDGSNVEESITRLAQMARAVGIHLILATQRPSVDVITGLIKANFPARVSFRVATKVDSRTILDANGAESLLGRGDLLYLPAGTSRVLRLHAPFVTEKEIALVVESWRAQGTAQYEQKFLEALKEDSERGESGGDDAGGEAEHDELFEDAVRLVLDFGKASTSLLQRRLRIGYGRAAHLIDLMEREGIVGPADGPKPREILKRPDWLSEVEEALR